MKFDLDYIAHNNKLFLVNPYYKLFFSLILMIVTLCYNNLYFDVLIFLLMVVLIIVIAGISVKSYLKFITIPFIFAFVTCLYLALLILLDKPILEKANLVSRSCPAKAADALPIIGEAW